MVEMDDQSVLIRVFVFGELSLERKRPDGSWETVPGQSAEWGRSTYGTNTKRLLGYLIFCERRQSYRFAITAMVRSLDLLDKGHIIAFVSKNMGQPF